MPEQVPPDAEPMDTERDQSPPRQGGRPGPDADPQLMPAQPAPATARPDTPPSDEEWPADRTPEAEPGPGEMGGELPTQDPAAPQGW